MSPSPPPPESALDSVPSIEYLNSPPAPNYSTATAVLRLNGTTPGPVEIDYDSSVTLTWTSVGADYCVGEGDTDNAWIGTKAKNGTQVISGIKESQEFRLQCWRTGEDEADFETSIRVNVVNVPAETSPPVVGSSLSEPRRTISGDLLSVVPFRLKVSPPKITVLADRQLGTYKGDFEVSLLLDPGPLQGRGHEVMEMINLKARGSAVKFISKQASQEDKSKLVWSATPVLWDLATGHHYYLTTSMEVESRTGHLVPIDFQVNKRSIKTSQVTVTLEKSTLMIEPGRKYEFLVAVEVKAFIPQTEYIEILALPFPGSAESTFRHSLTVNCEDGIDVIEPYYITTSSVLVVKVGHSLDLQMTTASAAVGDEVWSTNEDSFLLDHAIILTADGNLQSNIVKGPATTKQIMLIVKNTSRKTRNYAVKMITLKIIA
jgi:hypothetical protein